MSQSVSINSNTLSSLDSSSFHPLSYQMNLIQPSEYHKTISLLRDFFLSKGFIEVPCQSRMSILAACEDPSTVQTYHFLDEIWPLPQTGQMWLEHELLKNPHCAGFFCVTTSYREEKNPIPGRHHTIFPMFEFETHGGIEALKKLEKELVVFLGLADKEEDVLEKPYLELANHYGVADLSFKEEGAMCKEFSYNLLLTDFPVYTSPFWNMALYDDQQTAKKVDVIINGQETIGSAERSSNRDEMKHMFYTISEGGYAKLLFDKFGKERVEKELNNFLSYDFFQRCGGGIGVTRLISALADKGII